MKKKESYRKKFTAFLLLALLLSAFAAKETHVLFAHSERACSHHHHSGHHHHHNTDNKDHVNVLADNKETEGHCDLCAFSFYTFTNDLALEITFPGAIYPEFQVPVHSFNYVKGYNLSTPLRGPPAIA